MKKTLKQFNKEKGFTLVETLVAISVLVLAVTGAFSAAQGGISSYIFSKEQTIAFFLAQEGIEQIRNMRDENGIKGNYWLTGISQSGDPCVTNGKCMYDAYTNVISACSGNCPVLRQDPATGLYGYTSSWTPTPFTRDIQITTVNADEVAITVTISWSKGLVNRQFKARENIFNWQ